MKERDAKSFEMTLNEMFAVRGKGLVVLGNVTAGTIMVADQIKISNSASELEDIVLGVLVDGALRDSYTEEGEEKEVGLLLKKTVRKDLKGDLTAYILTKKS